MKKIELDIKKLVDITSKNFKNFNVDPKFSPKLSTSKDNVWRKITEEYFGCFCYKNSLLLFNRYKRNSEGFADMVENKMKQTVLSFENNLRSINIDFSMDEFKSFKISGNLRKRFVVDFEMALNTKLQEKGFNCYFRCNYNWFRQQTDHKNFRLIDWNGLYNCIEPNCSNFIKPKILCQPIQNVVIKVFYSLINQHLRILKNIRVTGEERNNMALSLKADGVVNFTSRHNFENNKRNLVRLNTLQKIKNELDNRFRLSRDLIFDLRATKVLCENLGISTNSEFMGFVHNICLDPYGFLMMSDIQIQIWNKVKTKNPVLFFDATGSIHKDVSQQKKPLLYSIVMHDKLNKQILPLAEFITTDQSIKSISSFLYTIDYNIQENRRQKDLKIAPIIVTDFSWALINSVLIVFNKMSIKEYLDWCFQKIITNEPSKEILIPNTRIYLCSTHFLKSMVKKAKQLNQEPNIRTLFIFCFSLLQNSVSIVQFKNYLLNISNIFNSKNKNLTLYYSLSTIRREIKNRNLDGFDHSSFESDNDQMTDEKQNLKSELQVDTLESLKKSSPFKNYFDSIIANFEEKINKSKMKSYGENTLYNPKLFSLIVDQLYLLPLWSGLIINDFKKNFESDLSECYNTRLTNNPVENYFGCLKNRVLGKRKVFPSEFVSLNFLRIKSKYYEFYFENKSPIIAQTNSIISIEEKWSDKNNKKKGKRQFRYEFEAIKEKGFYYKNKDIYKMIFFDLFEYDPNVFKISSHEFQKLSIFVDKFLDSTNNNDPMEVDNQNEISSNERSLNEFLVFNSSDYKKIYQDIIQDDKDSDYIKNYILSKKDKFIELTKIIRSRKNSVIYIDQLIENFRPFAIIIELFELKNFVPISTRGDGNCFYRSISFCLFGTDEFYYLFKIGSLFILLEYKNLFEDIIQKHYYSKRFEEIFFSSTRRNEWAMSLNILATSILLDRAIYSFGLNNETFVPYCQKYLMSNSDSEPIRLGFFINHFIPILNKSNHCFQGVENAFDLFVNQREGFKLLKYE